MSGVLRILIDVVCVGGAWDFYNGPVTDPERQRSCLDGNVTAGTIRMTIRQRAAALQSAARGQIPSLASLRGA